MDISYKKMRDFAGLTDDVSDPTSTADSPAWRDPEAECEVTEIDHDSRFDRNLAAAELSDSLEIVEKFRQRFG